MTRINVKILQVLALSLLATSAFAKSASLGGTFIADGTGARPIGMGGAFVAVANDANATWANPAGMGYFSKEEKYATFTHSNLFGVDGLKRDFLAYAQGNAGNFGALGVSWSRFSADLDGASWSEDAFIYSGAIVLGKEDTYPSYSLGWNLKYMRVKSGLGEAVDGSSVGLGGASGYGIDGAMMVKVSSSLSLGLMVRDVYSALSWDTATLEVLPTSGSAGMGYKFTETTTLAVEGRGIQTSGGFELESWHVGAEHWIFDGKKDVWGAIRNLGLRGGANGVLNNSDDGNLTVGASAQASQWQVDYSFQFGIASTESLGDTHRFGVSMAF